MPPDTKPESEQDRRRQSSVNSTGLQFFTSLSLLPGFAVITSLLAATIKLLYTPGQLQSWINGALGVRESPRGAQGWGCCANSPPQPSSEHSHSAPLHPECHSLPFPRDCGRVIASLAVWLRECPLHREPQQHKGYDPTLLQAQSLWI